MAKLIAAVGEVVQESGYQGLGVNRVAKIAKVNKELIYRYFDSFENLIESYVREKDHWNRFHEKLIENVAHSQKDYKQDFSFSILENHFNAILDSPEVQELLKWEILEKSVFVSKLRVAAQEVGGDILNFRDEHFLKGGLDIRAIEAIQIAGIYHLAILSRNPESDFFGLNLARHSDKQRVLAALKSMVELVYKEPSEESHSRRAEKVKVS